MNKRGFSLISIHHCSDLKLTVFYKLINVNNFNWTAVQLYVVINIQASTIMLYLFMLCGIVRQRYQTFWKPLVTDSAQLELKEIKLNAYEYLLQ